MKPIAPLLCSWVRKAGAALADENGASAHELMSIFGWLTIKEAERCTKAGGANEIGRPRNEQT